MTSKVHLLLASIMFAGLVAGITTGCQSRNAPAANRPAIPPVVAKKTGVGPAPKILDQPTTQVVNAGDTAVFSVVATNVGAFAGQPVFYQWHFNGAAIPGATNALLVISNVTPANAGAYYVTVTRNPSQDSVTVYLLVSTAGSLTIPVSAFTDIPSTSFGSTFSVCYNMETNLFAPSGSSAFIVDTLDPANGTMDTGLEIWQRKDVASPPLPKVVKVNDNYNTGTRLSRTQIAPQMTPFYYNIAVYVRNPVPAGITSVVVRWTFQ